MRRRRWQRGQRWGFEVSLPQGFDYAQADPEVRLSLAQWRAQGVTPLRAVDANEQSPASLFLPAGHRGPAFLVLNNFRSILKYNNSTAYALAIALGLYSLLGFLILPGIGQRVANQQLAQLATQVESPSLIIIGSVVTLADKLDWYGEANTLAGV